MVDRLALERLRTATTDGQELIDTSFGSVLPTHALQSLSQRLRYGARHGFAGLPGQCFGELVRFLTFYVQRQEILLGRPDSTMVEVPIERRIGNTERQPGQSFARACPPCQPLGIDASSLRVYGIFGCL